jgi:hypothetical protein
VGAKGTSIQFPILVKIGGILDSGMYIGGVGGVYFTLPVGNGELKTYTFLGNHTFTGEWKASAGFMVGGVIGVVLGPGVLFADIRYGMDFSEVEFEFDGNTIKPFKKSGLGLGVGYTLSLSG